MNLVQVFECLLELRNEKLKHELDHMTKMAAMPIYSKKTFENLLLQHQLQLTDGLVTKVCSIGTQVLPIYFK